MRRPRPDLASPPAPPSRELRQPGRAARRPPPPLTLATASSSVSTSRAPSTSLMSLRWPASAPHSSAGWRFRRFTSSAKIRSRLRTRPEERQDGGCFHDQNTAPNVALVAHAGRRAQRTPTPAAAITWHEHRKLLALSFLGTVRHKSAGGPLPALNRASPWSDPLLLPRRTLGT